MTRPGESPVKALRERMGVSRTSLALQLGMSYAAMAAVETGKYTSLPESWFPALERLGINAPSLAAEYLDWRAAQARTVAGF